MRNGKRGRYTLEFKLEAVRLVKAARAWRRRRAALGVAEQTLPNWVKAASRGQAEGLAASR